MGFVAFIGAGPGAADLITVRGARLLAQAEVVLHDALTDPALRELAPQARWIDVGKRGFCDSVAQTSINALLVRHGRADRRVVRLKGGDPSVFGRLEEELEALLAAGIDCEVVPGVTAAIAAAAATRRPLTRRGSGRSVSLSTAMTAVAGPRPAAGAPATHAAGPLRATRTADTEVIYMAGKQLAALGRQLAQAGWPADTPVSVVSRAGWPDQIHSDHRVETLAGAALLHAGRPTVVTVGAGARPVQAAAGHDDAAAIAAVPTPSGAARTPPAPRARNP
ncbi:uroporphyrinogen-III C-methyltransferase [Piscinibacter sakaiensis]|uniref:uroporphyrinogen-III C-methyltransferase n=1 Tax=Piscinibacter sakaiensis TaxID=1547922 RepID=A0A0K8P0J3_PISS1|nr:uroporphyrinogen-III C-methyltransferase [Piscinibacter sakaiensis]GAP35685.1 uroporphyrinogen-III methyltransferase [Piscinibacter sakaiensis]